MPRRIRKEQLGDESEGEQRPVASLDAIGVSVAVVDARKAPKVSNIKTYGDLSVLLAVAIVILNRLLKLKVKKPA